jgi:hypothetical protein
MEKVEFSKDEFKAWTEHRITKSLVEHLMAKRKELVDYLAGGNTLGKEADYSTDRVVGNIEGVTEIFNAFHEAKEDAQTEEEDKPSYDH